MNNAMIQVFYIAALFGLMYFLLIRPQRKKNKELAQMRDALKAGDRVITIGGIKGEVKRISEDDVLLKVGETQIEFKKWAIGSVEK
jgi:preprotein translocase subunit YajC